MKQEGLRAIALIEFKATWDSKHNFLVSPNLFKQDFDIKGPHRNGLLISPIF
jgi:hypothetical protein